MSDLAKNSVLIVDDEAAIRGILERLFRSAGYAVGSGANGAEGWQLFQITSWDVVVVDRGMPEMNGEELAAKIKEQRPEVPIIMITGLPHLVARRDLFFAVLAKPFRPTDLMDKVAQALATAVRC